MMSVLMRKGGRPEEAEAEGTGARKTKNASEEPKRQTACNKRK